MEVLCHPLPLQLPVEQSLLAVAGVAPEFFDH